MKEKKARNKGSETVKEKRIDRRTENRICEVKISAVISIQLFQLQQILIILAYLQFI